jgi:spore maturation protein SpmB
MATKMMIEVMESIVRDQSEENMRTQLNRLTEDELHSLGRIMNSVEVERMDRQYRHMEEELI